MENNDAIRIELAKRIVELEEENQQLKAKLMETYNSLVAINNFLETCDADAIS